jgi:uncharacterized membrane protein (UPF0127 family)
LEPARIEQVGVQTASGVFTFQAEIADTPELRERGLMFRQRLPDDRGMLFELSDVGEIAMWMRNTYVALDMVFIGNSGTVTSVVSDTVPLTDTIIRSEGVVAAVLELKAGTAKRIGLKAGDRIIHPSFPEKP